MYIHCCKVVLRLLLRHDTLKQCITLSWMMMLLLLLFSQETWKESESLLIFKVTLRDKVVGIRLHNISWYLEGK